MRCDNPGLLILALCLSTFMIVGCTYSEEQDGVITSEIVKAATLSTEPSPKSVEDSGGTIQERIDSLYSNPQHSIVILRTWPRSTSLNDKSKRNEWVYASDLGDICIEVDVDPLLRAGDDIDHFDKVSLWLDEQSITAEPVQIAYEELTSVLDENDNIVASGPTQIVLCWDIDLSIGRHVVDFSIWTSTGEEFRYSWAFEIVE